jgi:peptidoglycan/xylan/chitin deacetylase (PgdA/CDA1 family)
MVWHSVPRFVQGFFPERIWQGDASRRQVYLTFDDGPVPGVTDFVLEQLEKRGHRATFFMVGDNIRKHRRLALDVLSAGHQIGNHTFNHLNGWKTSDLEYFENARAFDRIVEDSLAIQTSLFRPPYGLLKSSQAKLLSDSKKIVMWNVLSGDYDRSLEPKRILDKTSANTRSGSIVVFHDQQKTQEVLPKVLPVFLDFLRLEGFETALL